MSKNLCFIDWFDCVLHGTRVYIYTLLKEPQPDTTRIQILNLNRIHVQNDLTN